MFTKARMGICFVAVLAPLTLCASVGTVQVIEPDRWTEPVPVTEVNTDSAEEWSPFLSYDGLTLYFARVRSDTFYYGRIFQASREQPSAPFTEVREIDGPLNLSPGHNLLPWVSRDNLRMYYHNESGGIFSLKISQRMSVTEPWPEGTSILELNALGDRLQAPKLTADELTIFFNAYEVPGGKGGYNILMASRDDRNLPFGQVRNLSEINTMAAEGAPSISPDGFTLVFHSNRNGPMQLFCATRGSLTEPFCNIQHLSFADTPGGHSMHPYLTGDGATLYFVGQMGEDRTTRDIYVSYIPEPATLLLLGAGTVMLRRKRY